MESENQRIPSAGTIPQVPFQLCKLAAGKTFHGFCVLQPRTVIGMIE
jgi:hypothetical protein